MAKAVRFHEHGGPEVLQYEDVEVGDPGPGQARIRHTAIGVNFVDTYQRSGLYPMPLPMVAGNEAAGVVEAVGSGVTELKAGDRVAYTGLPGSYCEQRVVPADRLVKLPQGISDEQAASMMLKGLTVHYLIHSTYAVKKGETVLWHAAAGGVGLIACQWLKALGVTVIGTAGSDEKCALARAHGAEHVINYTRENFVERVKSITGGKGVPVVYDAVGKTTWDGSLDCLQPRGLMVSFGNASGAVPPVNLGILSTKGSLYVTRPTLATYIASRADLVERSSALFEMVKSGKLKIETTRALQAGRCRAGAPRSRGPQDDRFGRPSAVNFPRPVVPIIEGWCSPASFSPPPPAAPDALPTAPRSGPLSWDQANSFTRKLEAIEKRRMEKSRKRETVLFTQGEVNSYLNLTYAEKLPKGRARRRGAPGPRPHPGQGAREHRPRQGQGGRRRRELRPAVLPERRRAGGDHGQVHGQGRVRAGGVGDRLPRRR